MLARFCRWRALQLLGALGGVGVFGAACTPTTSLRAGSGSAGSDMALIGTAGESAATLTEGGGALGSSEEDLSALLKGVPAIAPMLAKAASYRLQVLISVPRDGTTPWLKRSGYRVDAEYFFPASAIKLPMSIAALEKLADIRKGSGASQVGIETPLRIFSTPGGRYEDRDISNVQGATITIGHEVRKSLVVSSNEAFNRLFDFVGYDEVNQRMVRDGFDSVRFRHTLGFAATDPRRSSRIQFLLPGRTPMELPERPSAETLAASSVAGLFVGDAHYDGNGRLVNQPMSFEEKNRVSLRDLQDMLISVMRPELLSSRQVQLEPYEREFLVRTLGTPPSESKNPVYSAKEQPDELHRPLLIAVRKALPSHRIRSYGKGGQAYGFVVQNSYLVNETSKRSVFVAATLHVNEDGTLNDDQYEYSEVAKPFIDALGELLAKHYLN